jgi:two-component system chemotaxis sensor kinase CheA
MSEAANELLQQFIPEARELLEQAGGSLLALERSPGDSGSMNELFRAVHTLKGTSGLFDVGPLTRVVHTAEDLLGAVQSGRLALTGEMTDVLLGSLDQVGVWVDSLASAGGLPPAAGDLASSWTERLRMLLGDAAGSGKAGDRCGTAATPAALPSWVAALSETAVQSCCSDEADGDVFAIAYTPDRDCFFRGEDPLALMRQMQGLRLLSAEPVDPWPPLDMLDPFVCNLRFHAIAAAPEAEIAYLFRYIPDQIEVVRLPAGWPRAASDPSPQSDITFQTICDGQRRLLAASGPEELWPGRVGAAGRALRGVIQYAGRDDLSATLEAAIEAAETAGGPAPLLAFIDGMSRPAVAQSRQAVQSELAEPRAAGPATLRVEASKIDALMSLIGELVVAKNGLAYLARRAEEGSLSLRELAREIKDRQALVNRIAEEMHGAVMAVRMLPVDHVFQRFPRLVRDIARRFGKHVDLVVEGGDTEADKNVIEALADPLIHMVRNSLDHGIESPEDRIAVGKPETGVIRLAALQDNDNVVIRVSDDGRGIDPDAVRCKAVEKGLLEPERAAALDDEEAAMLVFAPGFSTAAAVSDISGRGIGMDVVRSAVEKVGGRVTLSSRKGAGTTVELTLPLSMAVSRIMMVECCGRLFGVPMAVVVETVRVPRNALHRLRDREAFVLRDSVVPVVRLARLLDLPDENEPAAEEAVLVVRLNGERLGVVIGAFREGMEVIVKPMDGILANVCGFAGTTLLGDGRVLLILDLRELVV